MHSFQVLLHILLVSYWCCQLYLYTCSLCWKKTCLVWGKHALVISYYFLCWIKKREQSSAINCLLLLSVTLAFLFLGSSLLAVTVNAWYNPGSGSVHLFSLTCISGLATSNTIFLHSSLESNATASSLFWTSWPFI